jgi:hypothetical protein
MKQTLFVLIAVLVVVGSAVSAAPAKGQVTLCHRAGKAVVTITVPQAGAAAHFAHGDTAGACQASPSK